MSEANKTPDFTSCPHWGKGGRYVVDPVTGQRVPVVETAETEPAPAPAEPPKPKKGK